MRSDGRPITIYDIAEETGVSPATVSRALSGGKHVSPKTLNKVTAAAERHGFRPSAAARGLNQGHTRLLAILLPDLAHPYFSELHHAAHREAARSGYFLVPMVIRRERELIARMMEQLRELRFEGVLYVDGPHGREDAALEKGLSRMHRSIPVVAISPLSPELKCICLYNDLAGATRQAVRHLHALGHERITFLGGPGAIGDSGARGRAFLSELENLGLKNDPRYRHEAGFTPEDGELAALKLLDGLPPEDRPTALIAINDLVALGALRQLKRMGLSVPADIAVVGCDNQFFSAFTDPPLTTIDLRPREHAQSAVRELLGAPAREGKVYTLVRDAALVVRESCGVRLGRRFFG